MKNIYEAHTPGKFTVYSTNDPFTFEKGAVRNWFVVSVCDTHEQATEKAREIGTGFDCFDQTGREMGWDNFAGFISPDDIHIHPNAF